MPVPGLIPPPISRQMTIGFESNVDNVDLFALLGEPDFAVDVFVQVSSGAIVGAALNPGAASPNPAMKISGFATGSRVYIANYGRIAGGGGIGGDGDRGRRDTQTQSAFVGGGGGGGAGSSSQGGLESPADFDADNTATDGTAGTDTLGGDAGDQDPNEAPGVADGGFALGQPAQLGGHAIVASGVELIIENTTGEIWAGANGGEGGYQNAPLSGGGTVAPEDGDDLASSVTLSSVPGFEPSAIYLTGGSLTWVGGDSYPEVAGYVREIA